MNGLSIRELCCLFCCPPCPSRIAAKLAFLPPEPTYALLPDPDPGSGAGTASGSSSGPAVPSLGAPGLRSRLSTGSGSDRGGGGSGGGAGGGGGGGGGGSSTGSEGRWKLHLTERAEFQYSQRELDVTDVFLTRSSRGNRVGCMYIRCAPNARWGTHHPLNTFRLNMPAHTYHNSVSLCFAFVSNRATCLCFVGTRNKNICLGHTVGAGCQYSIDWNNPVPSSISSQTINAIDLFCPQI